MKNIDKRIILNLAAGTFGHGQHYTFWGLVDRETFEAIDCQKLDVVVAHTAYALIDDDYLIPKRVYIDSPRGWEIYVR